MYKKRDDHPMFDNFLLPFDGKLNPKNRWVLMSKLIPWDLLEDLYGSKLSDNMGRPGKNVRVAFGAQIIKHKLNLSDDEVVEQISENPYLQYFIGFEEFRSEAPFDSSLLTRFRKRFDLEDVFDINELIAQRVGELKRTAGESEKSQERKEDGSGNSGKLIMDATVAPADVKYPTDLGLLNQAREETERMIDELWDGASGVRKPRTYRKKARKKFLAVSKKRRPGRTKIRKAVKSQLGYVKRNLSHIEKLLAEKTSGLSLSDAERLKVIKTLYRQQNEMFKERKHRVDERIVSLSQPHVRPIVRGKASASVEFGAKLSVSLVDGIARIDRLSWDAYNESEDLIPQVEAYKERNGFYPASVHGDGIYGTRSNRAYLKSKEIRFSGKPLGRPPKENDANKSELKEKREEARRGEIDRIPIEGKFGQGKRKYGLDLIKAKL
ncbi:MAG: IS5 family transposase, partial [Victivallales bacterium]|nr:IS5 family transposase [Victivallales bacterium]